MIYFTGLETPSKNTAGAKAPADIVALCRKRGYQYIPIFAPNAKYKNAKLRKLITIFEGRRYWKEVSRKLAAGDVLQVVASGRTWSRVVDPVTGATGYVANDYMVRQ